VLGKDAGRDADVERRERPGERHHLGDAKLFGGLRRREAGRQH
jgi:hypothetical protein